MKSRFLKFYKSYELYVYLIFINLLLQTTFGLDIRIICKRRLEFVY